MSCQFIFRNKKNIINYFPQYDQHNGTYASLTVYVSHGKIRIKCRLNIGCFLSSFCRGSFPRVMKLLTGIFNIGSVAPQITFYKQTNKLTNFIPLLYYIVQVWQIIHSILNISSFMFFLCHRIGSKQNVLMERVKKSPLNTRILMMNCY